MKPYYEDNLIKIFHGNCHEIIPQLNVDNIDLLYSNPPFGITEATWDTELNWKNLWKNIWSITKERGVVALHSSMPFTFDLVNSQRKYFKYNYIWVKNNSTGFFSADKQPLREHEDICVFYRKQPTYNPQMFGNEFHKKRLVSYGGTEKYWGERECNKERQKTEITEDGHYGRYPGTVLSFPIDKSSPDEEKAGTRTNSMIDFFILTYTNPNDIVLDITMNTGITIARCKLLGRKSIGIDLSEKYCEQAAKRCRQEVMALNI